MKKTFLFTQIIFVMGLLSGCNSLPMENEMATVMSTLELKFERMKDLMPLSISDEEYLRAKSGDADSIKSICTKLIDTENDEAKTWCDILMDYEGYNIKAYLALLSINHLLPEEDYGYSLFRLRDDATDNFQHKLLNALIAETSYNPHDSGPLFLKAAYDLDRILKSNPFQYKMSEDLANRMRLPSSTVKKISAFTENGTVGIVVSLDMTEVYDGDDAVKFCVDKAYLHLRELARLDYPEAQYQLALYYHNHWDFSQLKDKATDEDLAYLWARRALNNNYYEAASLMWQYSDKTQDDLSLIKRSADAGDTKSKDILANYYFSKKEYSKALPWLEQQVVRNDKLAMYRLGYMYVYGLGVTKNQKIGISLLEIPARNGESRAIDLINKLYSQNNLSKTEKKQLINILTDAAKSGSAIAMARVAQSVSDTDPQSAKYWYKKAITEGKTDVLSSYALLLMNEKNYKEAFSLLCNAKNVLDPLGRYLLAACYMEGMGTNVNKDHALVQLTKSADAFPYSQYVLGHSYMHGVSCVDHTDYIQARHYLEKFLSNENLTGLEKYKHEAEYMLAYLYHEGMGGEKNMDKFRHYAQRACDGGEAGACEWISAEAAEVKTQQVVADEVAVKKTNDVPQDKDLQDRESFSDRPYHQDEKIHNTEPQTQSKVKDFITDFFR